MSNRIDFNYKNTFVKSTKSETIKVIAIGEAEFKKLKNKTDKVALEANGFKPTAGNTLAIFTNSGELTKIYVGITSPMGLYDISYATEKAKIVAKPKTVFEISGLSGVDLETASIAWGLACQPKDKYKSEKSKVTPPTLLLSSDVNGARVKSYIKSISLVRDMINAPANDLGPEELASAVSDIAKDHKAKVKVITNQKTLEKDFPLVHVVGKASDRAPRLVDLNWGKSKHPKITLVGKGVIYDTGGLNLKPGQYMKHMKKDMGGAAHVLALANLIMSAKLPVCLRVIIPAVENSISGPAFRPGDILRSRKGLTVENTNTDAEGRLILADSLTLASEKKTDVIIDCATLTGSARAALGPDVPPFFTNNPAIAKEIQAVSFIEQDHLWFMPLLDLYKKTIESPIADLVNSAGAPGDLIYSALFLEQFLNGHPDWVHVDMYAWNDKGQPGRPSGGSDTGLRSLFSYLEKRFGE